MVANNTDIEAKVFAKLAQWNIPRDGTLAVAFSGGGDSTALLALMLKWCASGHVYAFIIDHALREGSGKDAKLAEKRAHACGINASGVEASGVKAGRVQTRILTCSWPNEKSGGIPTTAIQEKARFARYKLLAQACDDLEIEGFPLFIGHNQGDQAETVLMREQAGSGWRGLAGIAEKTAMPIYPTIAQVKVLRPLLSCTRDELRAYNIANGHNWIDDPSNENRSFARIRARDYLEQHPRENQRLLLKSAAARETLLRERDALAGFVYAGHAERDYIDANSEQYIWGATVLKRSFQQGKLGQIAEALKYILWAIAGQGSAPNVEKRMNLARQLAKMNFKSATLGGVRFFAARGDIYCVRDLGALTGRHQIKPLPPLALCGDIKRGWSKSIWDGRYGVAARHEVTVEALANWQDKLDKQQREALQYIPKPARGGLPVFIRNGQIAFVPFLEPIKNQVSETPDYWVRSLVSDRLYALLGE